MDFFYRPESIEGIDIDLLARFELCRVDRVAMRFLCFWQGNLLNGTAGLFDGLHPFFFAQ